MLIWTWATANNTLYGGQESHNVTFTDLKWDVAQAEMSKQVNNNFVVMMAESLQPNLAAERIICTLNHIWKYFGLWWVDDKIVETGIKL